MLIGGEYIKEHLFGGESGLRVSHIPELTVMDSNGVIRQIIEPSSACESEAPAEEADEEDRLARAIALSLTSPMPASHPKAPAKAARTVRFNLPYLDTPPRHVPVIPRLRSVRFRPPPAPTSPKPGPPPPPSSVQRMTAAMRFFQSTGHRLVTPHDVIPNRPLNGGSIPEARSPWSDSAYGPPEVTPEPEPEPADDSEAESFVFDPPGSSQD